MIELSIGVVAATSAAAWLLGRRRARSLGRAVATTLDTVGYATLFLGLNVGVAAGCIIAIRAAGGPFMSLHLATDVIWIPLSLLQGLMFQAWRASASSEAGR